MDNAFSDYRKEFSILWLVLIFVVLTFILVGTIRNNTRSSEIDAYLKKQEDHLDQQMKSSQKKIDSLLLVVNENKKQIQELQSSKQKIRLVYVQNDAQIDTLNYSGIVDKFTIIFAKSDIK